MIRMSRYWDTSSTTWKAQVSVIKLFFLTRILVDTVTGLVWERQFKEISIQFGWEKGSNWDC